MAAITRRHSSRWSSSEGAGIGSSTRIIDVFDDLTGNATDLEITKDTIGRIKSLLGKPE
jgi:hypothetical protein